MRRTFWVGLCLPALAAGAPTATAQEPVTTGRREHVSPPGWFGPGPAWHKWSDPGPGPGWTYFRVPDGPTVVVPPQTPPRVRYGPGPWGIPGAFGSFWTNGQSLYGPPVPTYAPIPGSFGGSDYGKHFFKNPPPANSIWVGLGWLGYRTPSPRPASPSVNVWPQGPPPDAPAAQAATGACIRLAVRVPTPDAEVWVEKTQVSQTGTDRLFESPPLAAGTYRYEVVARWKADGLERTESRAVTGSPGQTLSVDFTAPAAAPADQPGERGANAPRSPGWPAIHHSKYLSPL